MTIRPQPKPTVPQPAVESTPQPATREVDVNTYAQGDAYETAICTILELGFTRPQAEVAMEKAMNDPDRAMQYLLEGQLPTESLNPLSFLESNPRYQDLKAKVKANPNAFGELLQKLFDEDPELAQVVISNQELFMQQSQAPSISWELIKALPAPPLVNKLSQEEAIVVRRLTELGYHPKDALKCFLDKQKDEQTARDELCERYDKIQLPDE